MLRYFVLVRRQKIMASVLSALGNLPFKVRFVGTVKDVVKNDKERCESVCHITKID